MSNLSESFSDDFCDWVLVGGSDSPPNLVLSYETCVGEGCNESKFVVGSAGCGNIGSLTYCPDCYLKVSKIDSENGKKNQVINIKQTIETSDKVNDFFDKDNSLTNDSNTKMDFDFDDRTEMFNHFVAVNSRGKVYYVKLQISDDKALSYKMVHNKWGRSDLLVCKEITIPELYG